MPSDGGSPQIHRERHLLGKQCPGPRLLGDENSGGATLLSMRSTGDHRADGLSGMTTPVVRNDSYQGMTLGMKRPCGLVTSCEITRHNLWVKCRMSRPRGGGISMDCDTAGQGLSVAGQRA